MKRILFLTLVLFAVSSTKAQRQRSTQPQLPEMTIEEAIARYDFHSAELLLNHEITTLKKKKLPAIEQEEKLAWVHKAQIKLNAIEQVTFIDSIIVPRKEVLKHIHLNPECGKIGKLNDNPHKKDTLDCSTFMPQMGDQIYYAQPDTAGVLNLFMHDIYNDGTTSEPTTLSGINDNESNQNYPYMMTDGATIYFASQGTESLGGYDIFMSRYDTDGRRFLAPENIGMPFNSPANDYLYCIDETNNLGWFVTDRNTSEDSVCIYVFIPNEIRRVYTPEEIGNDTLANLAQIKSIRDTWKNEDEIRGAQARLKLAKNIQRTSNTPDFSFVVTDNQIYHKRSDFRKPKAQEIFDKWKDCKEELRKVQHTLNQLREKYHNATPQQRNSLKSEILMLEKNEENLHNVILQQEKDMRKAELGL